jgi:hypothetical protein
LKNREKVVDFFGDNRETWYKKLLSGGTTFSKVSLDSHQEYDGDENDLPPLDPLRITEERAGSIAKFFAAYPEANEAFVTYSS